jgi:glycosyltransferase involved in cell wall biosynthesis
MDLRELSGGRVPGDQVPAELLLRGQASGPFERTGSPAKIATVVLVVPCFNEAGRLDAEEFLRLCRGGIGAARVRIQLLFVNDGSSDSTRVRLHELAVREPGRIDVLEWVENRGKGEAVRRGLLRALESGADIVGYLDADLSVPVEGMLELLEVLCASNAQAVLGARVAILGREIERRAVRHYLGRVFATFASLALGIRVYDTQCGGKVFRSSPALRSALSRPFISRWVFDVELLGRLLSPHSSTRLSVNDLLEHPLRVWRHKPGSKVGLTSMAAAARDLALIAFELARRAERHRAGCDAPAGSGLRRGSGTR